MNHCFDVQKRQRGLFWGHHVSNPLLEDLESLLISVQPTHTALWHLLSTTPCWTQYHFAILNSAIQWLVAHSENGIHPMASQWNHGSSCPQQLFLIQTVIACFRLMVSAAMLQEAYAVLPGTKTLFCQFLSHPVSKFYSIVYHYFSDGLLFSHTTYHLHHWTSFTYQMDRWSMDLNATFLFLGMSHAISFILDLIVSILCYTMVLVSYLTCLVMDQLVTSHCTMWSGDLLFHHRWDLCSISWFSFVVKLLVLTARRRRDVFP